MTVAKGKRFEGKFAEFGNNRNIFTVLSFEGMCQNPRRRSSADIQSLSRQCGVGPQFFPHVGQDHSCAD
eukprot:748239-Hanusia_phi.AAC.1